MGKSLAVSFSFCVSISAEFLQRAGRHLVVLPIGDEGLHSETDGGFIGEVEGVGF